MAYLSNKMDRVKNDRIMIRLGILIAKYGGRHAALTLNEFGYRQGKDFKYIDRNKLSIGKLFESHFFYSSKL